VSAFGSSALSFYDTYSFGSSPVMILTAFALAPAPEPDTVVLLVIGVISLLGYVMRVRHG
jgi:hypothetical protein